MSASDWHPCQCGHLGVAHAADGGCRIGWLDIRESCECPQFVAAVA